MNTSPAGHQSQAFKGYGLWVAMLEMPRLLSLRHWRPDGAEGEHECDTHWLPSLERAALSLRMCV